MFEDEHKDDQGNLNDSVENITTDDSDVKTEADLPDPNETGKKFDEEGEKQAAKSAPKAEEKAEAPKTETKSEAPKTETKAETPKEETKAEAPKESAPKKEEAAPAKSYEKAVDDYVEEMSQKSASDDEDAKELKK